MSRRSRIFVLFFFVLLVVGSFAFAQDTTTQAQSSAKSGVSLGLIAIAAGIAIAPWWIL